MKHVRKYCMRTPEQHRSSNVCFFCDYFFCDTCDGCSAVTLTTDCVGRKLSDLETTAVYQGIINFRSGYWLWEDALTVTDDAYKNLTLLLTNKIYYRNKTEKAHNASI